MHEYKKTVLAFISAPLTAADIASVQVQLEFAETMARLLCLPSLLCAARVGEPLGERGLAIDPFGDNVLSVSNIPGGSFTARHDLVKTTLHSIILDSGLRADCEVFGAFRDLIPAEELQ